MKRAIARIGLIIDAEDSITSEEWIRLLSNIAHSYHGESKVKDVQLREVTIPSIENLNESEATKETVM